MLSAVSADARVIRGFVRLALKHDVRIVPVVWIGGHEAALFLGLGEHIARLLHLRRLLRIDVAPVRIALPWGITLLDLPLRLPLPAKVSIEVLSPIDLREDSTAPAAIPRRATSSSRDGCRTR